MDALTKKKKDRFRFLNRLYERTEGDSMALEDMWEIGTELGMSSLETERAVEYLVGEGLATHRGIGGVIEITHAGVVEVEGALSQPEKPTHYFPPVVNILHVQSMVGSQIQQGNHGSTQSQAVTQNELDAVRELTAALRQKLASLPLTKETKQEAEAELQTVEAQLRSSKPKIAILQESLRTLRHLIEGVASNALAAGILPLFEPLAAMLAFK